MTRKLVVIFRVVIICLNISLMFTPFLYTQGEERDDKGGIHLKELAEKKDKYVGTCVASQPLKYDNKYSEILASEFNVITPEDAFKFALTEPKRNYFTFKKGDTIVDFAKSNNMKIRGHTLVWHRELPEWLRKGHYSREELMQILHNHIKNVVGHYKGKVYCWDVINEAFESDGSLRHSIWYDTIGSEYIEMAFQWAHEADPDALLFYNDFDAEDLNSKSDGIYKMIKKIKHKGVPINGIGFQSHFGLNYVCNFKNMDYNMKRFAQLGLETDITELDVSIIKNAGISREDKLKKQAEVFENVFRVCCNNPSCKMIVMWGFTDAHSWKRRRNKNDAPTIFDEQYNPKPAYYEIIKAFQGRQIN